ncbi:MAG: hypothetical protein ABI634_09430 [Acidobacteriota bacterium]
MRIGKMKSVLCGAAFLLATAAPAFAQGTVGAGISFLHGTGDTAPGVTIDYSNVKPAVDRATVGFVGDFGLNRSNGVTLTSYQGGVRVGIPGNAKVHPFAQFVVGAEHCCSSTNFTLQPGVGVDIPINETLNFRAQIDFRTVRVDGASFNEQRYTFGVSLPVGAAK